MDLRGLLRGIGAWLAFALCTALAVGVVWASMRSLYYPRTGDSLALDGALGLMVGLGLIYGAFRMHRALEERDILTIERGWFIGVALGVSVPIALGLASMTEGVARHSSGFLDGIEYAFLAAAGVLWVAGCLIVLAIRSRTWRGFWTSVALTAGALGSAGVLFTLYLWSSAERLQTIATERNKRVPGFELVAFLAAVAVLALLRRRRA